MKLTLNNMSERDYDITHIVSVSQLIPYILGSSLFGYSVIKPISLLYFLSMTSSFVIVISVLFVDLQYISGLGRFTFPVYV